MQLRQKTRKINDMTTTLRLLFSVLLYGLTTICGVESRYHKDCNDTTVIQNFHRLCKSWALLKRSTQARNWQDGQWQMGGAGSWPTGRQDPGSWWFYPMSQTPVQGFPSPFVQKDYLDPVKTEGEDSLTAVERWRRNKEVEERLYNFIVYECCTTGCPFPESYWAVEKSTNICSLR